MAILRQLRTTGPRDQSQWLQWPRDHYEMASPFSRKIGNPAELRHSHSNRRLVGTPTTPTSLYCVRGMGRGASARRTSIIQNPHPWRFIDVRFRLRHFSKKKTGNSRFLFFCGEGWAGGVSKAVGVGYVGGGG